MNQIQEKKVRKLINKQINKQQRHQRSQRWFSFNEIAIFQMFQQLNDKIQTWCNVMQHKSPTINTLLKILESLCWWCYFSSAVPFEAVVYVAFNSKCVYNTLCTWFAYMVEQQYWKHLKIASNPAQQHHKLQPKSPDGIATSPTQCEQQLEIKRFITGLSYWITSHCLEVSIFWFHGA